METQALRASVLSAVYKGGVQRPMWGEREKGTSTHKSTTFPLSQTFAVGIVAVPKRYAFRPRQITTCVPQRYDFRPRLSEQRRMASGESWRWVVLPRCDPIVTGKQ